MQADSKISILLVGQSDENTDAHTDYLITVIALLDYYSSVCS